LRSQIRTSGNGGGGQPSSRSISRVKDGALNRSWCRFMLPTSRERLVVVGNGMAGMRTVEELLKLDAARYEITVFGAEPHPNYDRIMLSSVLAGEKRKPLLFWQVLTGVLVCIIIVLLV
jgi:hypothetical protein